VGAGEGVLDAFSRMLYAVTHYSKLQPLAYVPCCSNRAAPGAGGAQILSSVEFDCSGQLFAAAGEAVGWSVCAGIPGLCLLTACVLGTRVHACILSDEGGVKCRALGLLQAASLLIGAVCKLSYRFHHSNITG
jgi:hypothetical protein